MIVRIILFSKREAKETLYKIKKNIEYRAQIFFAMEPKKNRFLQITTVAVIFAVLVITGTFAYISSREEDKYEKAIRAGTEWFVNNQDEDFLHYEYIPIAKTHLGTGQRLREMGALWSIALAYNYFGDERYKDLAEKGFWYYEDTFKYDSGQDIMFVNITPEKIKLAYNAFAILTMLEIGHPKEEKYIEKFVNGIEFQQQEDGSFKTFFYNDRATGVDYYPGEAMFALMSLYEKTKEKSLVEKLEKAFPYYREYWRGNKNTGFIPWQSRAYRKLAVATGKKEYADFLFEMNDWLLDQHRPKNECSRFVFNRGITTAVFMEGVIQAYLQAKDMGDAKRETCYQNYIQEGADYILTLQIWDEEDPKANGGFMGNEKTYDFVTNNRAEDINQYVEQRKKNSERKLNFTRVDNNQHAITALMEAIELGLLEE